MNLENNPINEMNEWMNEWKQWKLFKINLKTKKTFLIYALSKILLYRTTCVDFRREGKYQNK